MSRRYVTIWFPYLTTDRLIIRRPELRDVPFVLASPERGRMVVRAANKAALMHGIEPGTVVADAKAILPVLQVIEDKPELAEKLLHALAEWCIRFTPLAATDPPNGLILDVTGCAHLWGGELPYLEDIQAKLLGLGFEVTAAMADTIGAAWAVSRYGRAFPVIESGHQAEALLTLPPAALRLEPGIFERLQKLGLYQIRNFIGMPRSVLRRRFGQLLLDRIDQALGPSDEYIIPVIPMVPYQERLPCLEPISTANGIKIALKRLLEMLCQRLVEEGKGLRTGVFRGYRMDGKIEEIDIVTNGPSCHVEHLFKLLELKIQTIEPALGIELFVLEAPVVEDIINSQEELWANSNTQDYSGILELLDSIAGRVGMNTIHRYLPDEHYWPERSVKTAGSFQEKAVTAWPVDRPRPVSLLLRPEYIEVTSPVPDYPPMLFRYKGKLHTIKKSDGPERIEREWWLDAGSHRDYYCLEDENGARYWVFRSGHYNEHKQEWFIHGFFA